MFDNNKINYAYIVLGSTIIEGQCTYWCTVGSNGLIRVIVDGKQYMTSVNNVIFTENEENRIDITKRI